MFKLKASIEKLEPYEKVVTTKNLTYWGSRHSEYRKAFDVKKVFIKFALLLSVQEVLHIMSSDYYLKKWTRISEILDLCRFIHIASIKIFNY